MSLVILLLLIIVLVLSFGGTGKIIKVKIMSGNRIPKILAVYVTVLLAASIFSFLSPVKQSFEGKYLSDEEIAAEEKFSEKVYPLIESGDIAEVKGLIEKKKWEFALKGNSLNVETNLNAATFVEKVDSLEDTVVITHYMTKSYVNNVDITGQFSSPDVQFENATIKMLPAAPVNLELVDFKTPFPVTQFVGNGHDLSGQYGMSQGMDIIYIRVPGQTKVSGDGHTIN
ncbi:hypothetical protein V7654_06580 [Bacillus sp. JJ1609]|uniref:hypothetical protein n=1 Tax=Bacillus sp. JJ1609 TaxID=3122977 RepID=UPI002FFEE17F